MSIKFISCLRGVKESHLVERPGSAFFPVDRCHEGGIGVAFYF